MAVRTRCSTARTRKGPAARIMDGYRQFFIWFIKSLWKWVHMHKPHYYSHKSQWMAAETPLNTDLYTDIFTCSSLDQCEGRYKRSALLLIETQAMSQKLLHKVVVILSKFIWSIAPLCISGFVQTDPLKAAVIDFDFIPFHSSNLSKTQYHSINHMTIKCHSEPDRQQKLKSLRFIQRSVSKWQDTEKSDIQSAGYSSSLPLQNRKCDGAACWTC